MSTISAVIPAFPLCCWGSLSSCRFPQRKSHSKEFIFAETISKPLMPCELCMWNNVMMKNLEIQ